MMRKGTTNWRIVPENVGACLFTEGEGGHCQIKKLSGLEKSYDMFGWEDVGRNFFKKI